MDELKAVLLHLARYGAARHAGELEQLEQLIEKAFAPAGAHEEEKPGAEGS